MQQPCPSVYDFGEKKINVTYKIIRIRIWLSRIWIGAKFFLEQETGAKWREKKFNSFPFISEVFENKRFFNSGPDWINKLYFRDEYMM